MVAVGREAFGLRVYYLSSRDAGLRLTGVLPLVEQSSVILGKYLISLPFFTYGGILANDPGTAGALAQRAGELARARRASHVELRHSGHVAGVALPERRDKVSMVLALPDSAAELSKRLGSKLRSQIKRAGRDQPEVVWGHKDLVGEFYAIFAETMHRLGTPVYSRRFFERVCDALGERVACLVLRIAGKPEAAAVIVRHGARIEVPWAATTEAAKPRALNMRLYWEMLTEGIRQGAAEFDFGRSTVGSGTHRFKEQWGAQPRQLHWHYWLSTGDKIPLLNHTNTKYALAVALWRRMPLWCANAIGPRIARNLP
jgi:FemAB-related protein (PEP-CTERM system-associated)